MDGGSTGAAGDQGAPDMSAGFANVYEDDARAHAYAGLDFPGTYWLAFRDLPAILARHATGRRALDFGCGAGRSTRSWYRPIVISISFCSPARITRTRTRLPTGAVDTRRCRSRGGSSSPPRVTPGSCGPGRSARRRVLLI